MHGRQNRIGRLVGVSSVLMALALMVSGPDPAAAQGRPGGPGPGQGPPDFGVEPGEILVQFQPGATGQEIAAAHRQNGGQEEDVLPEIDVHVVRVPPGQERARAAGYARNPNVRFAEPNHRTRVFATGPDPYLGQQWQYNNPATNADINAVEAWQVTRGGPAVAIAVLDTGIDQSHEDLPDRAKVAKSANFSSSRGTDDAYGHGTHVAGSASAATNNAVGVAGTCPDCVLYNVKVLGDDGYGNDAATARGINWATDNGAKVVSMSFGTYSASNTVQLAVDRAWSRGMVLAAAAGNDGRDYGTYPAAFANVVAAAATDRADARWSGSNYGWWVDVAAPGAEILSTAPDHANPMFGAGAKYGTLSGTSMAAPHVAGVAGLVWASGRCGPRDNACVRARIERCANAAVNGTGPDYAGNPEAYWAFGRVDAYRAVSGGAC
jgi:thermitase